MRLSRGIAAGLLALALAGCDGDDPTPEGLMGALTDAGVGLDPGTSLDRYFDAVEKMCDAAGSERGFSTQTLQGFTHPDSAEAKERMVVALEYACPGEGAKLDQLVRALSD